MSGVVLSPSAFSPHQHTPFQNPILPASSSLPSPAMSSRKRKADDDLDDAQMDRPSVSPPPGQTNTSRPFSQRSKQIKRARTNTIGRGLPLPRLLETLTPDQLRSVLRNICERHPDISSEITSTAPKPSVQSALSVLADYEASLRESFPYGDRPTSDYAFNRVRLSLVSLIDALKDYTPNFLPPAEQQVSTCFHFLDGATEIIHRLPEWDSFQHNRHKQDAYEEMSQAWTLAIQEAAKRAGGIQLQYNGWDQKLAKHNELSGGKLQQAVMELRTSLGWMDGSASNNGQPNVSDDIMAIRQQLMSNTYGSGNPIQVGPW